MVRAECLGQYLDPIHKWKSISISITFGISAMAIVLPPFSITPPTMGVWYVYFFYAVLMSYVCKYATGSKDIFVIRFE